MIKNGYKAFLKEKKVDEDKVVVLFEMTLNNLNTDGTLDEQDFLDRAEILCSLGQTVLISNYSQYYKLVEYFSRFTKERMGLIMGVPNLTEILNEKYYHTLSGGILEACGILFNRDLKIYLYPFLNTQADQLITSESIEVHPRLQPLVDYLVSNKRVRDLKDTDQSLLNIFSDDVIAAIKQGKTGWESKVPTYVDNIIKENNLFGFQDQKVIQTNKHASDIEV